MDQMLKNQCRTCKWGTGHPWPPCKNSVWGAMSTVERDAVKNGVLECMAREEKPSDAARNP